MSFLQHVLFVLLFFWHCGSPSVRHARKGKSERALRYEELLRFTSLTVNDGRLGVVATLEGEFGLAGADFRIACRRSSSLEIFLLPILKITSLVRIPALATGRPLSTSMTTAPGGIAPRVEALCSLLMKATRKPKSGT